MAPPQSGLALLPRSNSPDHNAKGTQSAATTSEDIVQPPTACRHVVSGSLSLPAQGCFSPVPHGTRPLSVTRESLALEGGPPSFTPDFSCRALLRNSTTQDSWVSSTGLSPSLADRSRSFDYRAGCSLAGLAAKQVLQPRRARTTVWACPRSLAATSGITVVFSSWRY